jgi:pyridoxine 5-phosphate synthase
MARLGVNIDHVATLRQARGAIYPEPVIAAGIAEQAGADQITVHLRSDRRHILDRDLELLVRVVQTRLNVEMATTDEMVEIVGSIRPQQVSLVPERPEEITTEGGLDVVTHRDEVARAGEALAGRGIAVSVFIDPDAAQIDAAAELGLTHIEFNTAAYAETRDEAVMVQEFARLERAIGRARERELHVAAGHGLHYHNVQPLAANPAIEEFNIGHAIVARAVFSGLDAAVREMKRLVS